MNDYTFTSSLLARTPLFSFTILETSFLMILKNQQFQAALFLASPSLFYELEKKQFDYEALTDRQKQTVKKYVNRAAFRSTPFGLFSSVSMVEWTEGPSNELVLKKPRSHTSFDFVVLQELWERHYSREAAASCLRTNPSLYFTKIDFRFFRRTVRDNQSRFSMVSVEKNSSLRSLLQYCRKARTCHDILDFLCQRNVDPEMAVRFIEDLRNEQILIEDMAPNLTGPDYFIQLSASLPQDRFIQSCKDGLSTVNGAISGSASAVCALSKLLDHELKKSACTNYFYCISERETAEGGVHKRHQLAIRQGLYCLQRLSTPFYSSDLQAFKKAFVQKYEASEVPLLEAMDAQFGIGYGRFEQLGVNYGFSSMGSSNSPVKENKSPSAELIVLLLKEWQSKSGWNYELQILDTDLQQLQGVAGDMLPPSMSVMFRTLGDQVLIESAGGPSALGLIGRFGVFDQVYRHGRAIAEKEQSLNDSVVFAEIAHLCNLHTANINRRPHFYDYEIPVLTPSILPDKMQIQLSDLFVSVKEDMVILRSRKLKKTVIPRLSSAFNYTKNDFPVFRFLADLQHQNLQPNFSFSLAALLPGLRFYPRVRYKSSILQLAEWHLHSDELLPCLNSSDAFGSFLTISREAGLGRYFSYSVGDHFLVIDLQKKEDVELFLTETKGKGLLVLKEFPFLGEQMVKTAAGQPLVAQYIALLYRGKEVYSRKGLLSRERVSTPCPVGNNDWIYFKVYCHPLSSDRILTTYLFPVVKKLKKKKYIDGWFWVRYNDPDYHIRIRVKAPHHAKTYVFHFVPLHSSTSLQLNCCFAQISFRFFQLIRQNTVLSPACSFLTRTVLLTCSPGLS